MSSSTSRVLSLAARPDGQSARHGRAGVVCRAAAKQAKGVVDDGYVYSACTERCDAPAPSSARFAGGDGEALTTSVVDTRSDALSPVSLCVYLCSAQGQAREEAQQRG